MQRYKWMLILGTFLLLWAAVDRMSSVNGYVLQVKESRSASAAGSAFEQAAVPAFAPAGGTLTGAELRERIRSRAKEVNKPPVNARIDPVWKAIPGLNGLVVDEEATYRAAQGHAAGDLPLVLREMPPQVTLKDLPPNPIYKGNPGKPMVSIMINVAWGDEYLPSILKTLREENVQATFFLDGTWLSSHEETARAILKAGHELSNHAYTHPAMSRLSRARATAEIAKTEALLRKLGVHNTLFAPPSGDYDEETVRIAHEQGLSTILWTLDTVDWKHPPAEQIVGKIARNVEAGSLILMHPTDSSSAALPGMIRAIKNKGLAIGTVSDLISPKRMPYIESPVDF